MKSNELNTNPNVELFQNALDTEDNKALAEAMEKRFNNIEETILAKYEELKDEHDVNVLASRGVRQLTNEEVKFYNNLFRADIGMSPTVGGQAIMPKTIIDAVFEDLREDTDNNPLALIDLQNTTGATEWLVSVAEAPVTAWGEMCEPITQELSVGFKVVNSYVNKLSAYIPYCKSLLDLGPVWQDTYLREYLRLGLKDGLTLALFSGNGSKMPWGMAYNYNIDTDTGTAKTAVAITAIDKANFGPIFKTLSTNPLGKHRSVASATLFVDSETYYDYIYANDGVMTVDGTYVSMLEKMGIKLCVCETGLTTGHGIIALPKRYFMQVAAKGGGQTGMVEFSDDYLFLEDKRVYKGKLFADGFLKDANGAVLIDFTGLLSI